MMPDPRAGARLSPPHCVASAVNTPCAGSGSQSNVSTQRYNVAIRKSCTIFTLAVLTLLQSHSCLAIHSDSKSGGRDLQ